VSEISAYLEQRRALVEAALDASIRDDGSRLVEAMRYALLGGGKRVRPILLLASADAVGADQRASSALMPFACAIEMIHAYSLVHDDLPAMDDDELRRGRPTLHVRYDEALAILAGDGLLTEAFSVMAGVAAQSADSAAARATAEIAAAAGAAGMVGGQADDMAAEGSEIGVDEVERIHRRKTGALLRAAVRAGALLAGAGRAQLSALTAYGDSLGLAFQVVDDVLDATAPTQATGKIAGRDRERGKRTYPVLLGLDGARARAEELRQAARSALEPFDAAADPLRDLVDFVVDRASRSA